MSARRKKPEELRSGRWFGREDLRSFGHRSRAAQMGYDKSDYTGKPIIAIINTWSDINPCHSHFKSRVDDIKRGVYQAGGFPLEMPAMALAEIFQKPTTMLYRNFLAMETEELLRAYPVDGCILMGGCDKTTPALLMGAISMNLPTVFMPAGPMLRGNWRGETLGSGSDVWKYWAELRAGNLEKSAWEEIENGIARSAGTCMTMGTAATMMALAEVLGFSLPNSSSIPAVDSAHIRMAAMSGRRVVEMVWEDLKPKDILSSKNFDNAVKVLLALGGSTNALIHLIALARRAGINLTLDRFDEFSRKIPLIANLRPSGKYLMSDFYLAGGLLAFLKVLSPLLDLSTISITGKSLGENIGNAEVNNPEVILPLDKPILASGGLAVLRGNLCPDGSVMKPSAADPALLVHEGPAIVFDSYDEMAEKIDDLNLDATKDSVLVLRNAGPLGGPGMPEWGQLPIPKKLLQQGVRDMVRISDARMSGTSYGACVLHVAPESYAGGPLALIRTGDKIKLDVPNRRLDVLISDEELAKRKAAWVQPKPKYKRGYGVIFQDHIKQANEGCDFDVLEGSEPTPEPEIH